MQKVVKMKQQVQLVIQPQSGHPSTFLAMHYPLSMIFHSNLTWHYPKIIFTS